MGRSSAGRGHIEECLPGERLSQFGPERLDSGGVAAIHGAEDGIRLGFPGFELDVRRLLLRGRGEEAGGVGRFDARRNHPFEEEILDAAALVELDERFVRSPRGGDAIAMDGAEQSEQLAAVGLRAAEPTGQHAVAALGVVRRRNGGQLPEACHGDEKRQPVGNPVGLGGQLEIADRLTRFKQLAFQPVVGRIPVADVLVRRAVEAAGVFLFCVFLVGAVRVEELEAGGGPVVLGVCLQVVEELAGHRPGLALGLFGGLGQRMISEPEFIHPLHRKQVKGVVALGQGDRVGRIEPVHEEPQGGNHVAFFQEGLDHQRIGLGRAELRDVPSPEGDVARGRPGLFPGSQRVGHLVRRFPRFAAGDSLDA